MIRPFLQPVSKGQRRSWYFSHLTAERCWRGIRKWNLPQIRARRKKRYPDYQVSFLSCTFVERWASNLSTTTQLPTANCRQPRDDAAVPGVGWPSLSFWVVEETLCLGPYIMDKHGLRVSWLVCGGNLLVGFLSGFLNMWPRKRSWRWCIVKIRRKGRSWPTWLKTLSLQTKSSCMSIMP